MTALVQVIGEALVDIVEDSQGTVAERPGGSPLNVAVGLGRLGHEVALHAAVGDDGRGAAIRAHLTGSSVALRNMARRGDRTSSARAHIRPDGSAAYDFDIRWPAPPIALRERAARIVHAGSLGAALAPGDAAVLGALRSARPRAITTFDPNVRPDLMRPRHLQVSCTERFFAAADVVKLSDEDAEWLYPGDELDTVVDRILNFGAALVAVTRGAEGSLIGTRHERLHLAARVEHVVDTIGAGDSFMAGLVHGIAALAAASGPAALRDGAALPAQRIETLGAFAHACAARTVARAGADLPWLAELEAQGVARGSAAEASVYATA